MRFKRGAVVAVTAAFGLLVLPLPRVDGDTRSVTLLARPTATPTTMLITTTTTSASTSTTVVVPARPRRVASGATRVASRVTPRAPAAGSRSAGIAKAVWDVPGSGYERGAPVVALTFDDGPDPTWTPQILDTLARYNAHATFFAIGRYVGRHADLVRRVVASGHGVGNHTWDHVDLRRTSDYRHQVDDTTRVLTDVTSRPIGCLRPPYGSIDGSTTAKLGQRGLTAVLWDVDSRDYTRPGADSIVQRTLSAVRAGSIVVLHDGGGDRSQTVAALPRILEGLQAAGLRSVAICNGTPPPPPTTVLETTTTGEVTTTTEAPPPDTTETTAFF